MTSLHVAVAQIHSRAGQLEENLGRMLRQVRAAAEVQAQAILFAETCTHGFVAEPAVLALAETKDGPIGQRLSAWAAAYGLAILAGFWERDGDRIYNSHLVAWPDGRREVERKCGITEAEEKAGVARGPETRKVFDLAGVRCAILICADAGVDALWRDLEAQRVQLRLQPTAGGGKREEMMTEAELADAKGLARYEEGRKCVVETRAVVLPEKGRVPVAFASANALGHDGRTANGWHRGHCMIVDRLGILRAQIPGTPVLEHQQDQMAHATLSFA